VPAWVTASAGKVNVNARFAGFEATIWPFAQPARSLYNGFGFGGVCCWDDRI